MWKVFGRRRESLWLGLPARGQSLPIGPASLDHFIIDFVPDRALAAKAFENQPLVQIEVTAELPWACRKKK